MSLFAMTQVNYRMTKEEIRAALDSDKFKRSVAKWRKKTQPMIDATRKAQMIDSRDLAVWVTK